MMNLQHTQSSTGGLAFGWCELPVSRGTEGRKTRLGRSLASEATGYLAMLAFLSAYLLSVAGAGRVVQAALNLTGAAVGAIYLHRKGAVPSVISNLAWVAITVLGLVIQRPF
jgi:hypothetical protein